MGDVYKRQEYEMPTVERVIGSSATAIQRVARRRLQIPAARLFPLQRFEQRLEIPLAETTAALALDHFVEQRRPVFHGDVYKRQAWR